MNDTPKKKHKPKGGRPDYTDFPGFQRCYDFKNDGHTFTMLPNILFEYMRDLTSSEVKVLLFILRQTFGWYKSSDKIGLAQFMGGIAGKSINRGTGLSRSTVRNSLKGLERKGFIRIKHEPNWVSTVSLVVIDNRLEMPNDVKKFLDAFKNDPPEQ